MYLMVILLYWTGDALTCRKCVAVENHDVVSKGEADCSKGNAVTMLCDGPTDECFESAFYMSFPPDTGITTS